MNISNIFIYLLQRILHSLFAYIITLHRMSVIELLFSRYFGNVIVFHKKKSKSAENVLKIISVLLKLLLPLFAV